MLDARADLAPAEQLSTKQARGRYVRDTLWATAQAAQAPLLAWLDARGIAYRSFYVVNAVLVQGDRSLALALAGLPGVARIDGNPAMLVPAPQPALPPVSPQSPSSPTTVEPNIAYANAPAVWSLGYQGQGVVVGGQDTGYEWQHPALESHYRGWDGLAADHDYNWHDAIHSNTHGPNLCGADSPVPCDDFGHGTHTMGIMVGDDAAGNQVGMAPGAKWIGCRNMDNRYGTPASYLECFEFFLAPYPVGGDPSQGDPSMAPDVTDNSWSCLPSEGCLAGNVDILRQAVEAQRAAGIMTVVSAGNDGPLCSTVGNPPGIYAASYTVGALNTGYDTIASFSSLGPVLADGSRRTKPDLVAPGTAVRSSILGDAYGWMSGTSMAAPHAAGAVALLWSARPILKNQVVATEDVLDRSAVHLLSTQGCGGDTPSQVPNNVFGYGRLNVLAAVTAVPADAGLLYGVASAGRDGATLSAALVQAQSPSGTTWSARTDVLGMYQLPLPPGTYTVIASAAGYAPLPQTGLAITTGQATSAGFALWQLASLSVAPSSLSVTLSAGDVTTRSVALRNDGDLPLSWDLSGVPSGGWLEAAPTGGSLAAQATASTTLTLTAPSIAGDYLVSLQFGGDAANSPVTVPVSLTVSPLRYYFPWLPATGR